MVFRIVLAALVAALLLAAPARAESLFGSWDDLRELAGVDRADALTLGPDGRIWFTAPGTTHVGAVDAQGAATTYALDPAGHRQYGLGPSAVLPNPDATAWVLDGRGRLGLWRLADSQLLRRVTMLPSPDDDAFPAWRTPGGSVWTYDDDTLAQMRPDGVVVRYRPFGRDGDIEAAAAGPDGRVWLYGAPRRKTASRLVKVDEQGTTESLSTGEDAYEGATLTWGGGAVVAGETLWYPVVRSVRGRDVVVLLGAAAGRPLRQMSLGVSPGDGFDGGVTLGAGPGGTIAFADRSGATVGLVEGTTVRRLASLARGDRPEDPVLDGAGRVWVSLSRGRLAAIDPAGAVSTFADGVPRDRTGPRLSVSLPSPSLARLLGGGLRVRVRCDQPCGAEVSLAVPRRTARRLGVRDDASAQTVPLPRGWIAIAVAAAERRTAGSRLARFRLARGARGALAAHRRLRVRVVASAYDQSLDLTRRSRSITLR